jgi:tetratricopeptide (TPR) repeat protein
MSGAADETLQVLRDRIRHHSPDRYPVQHATARFHLGVTLLQAGQAIEATAELAEAVAVFRTSGLAVEHGKAILMLGIALRDTGRLNDAERAFTAAAQTFADHHQPSEHAAALHNLGMVLRDRGELEQAAQRFEAAAKAFDELGELTARSSADRELGATLLTLQRPREALSPLQRAMEESGARGDPVAWGSVANSLGLARLACEELVPAEEAFRAAVSANPRTVRPEGYAMAKANLALVYEEAGSPARARLAARQAAAVTEAPGVVRTQAAGVLERLGDTRDDLAAILDEESDEGWAGVLRDELMRWADADEGERLAAAGGWVDGVLVRRDRAADLLFSWFDAVLELPPESMDRVLAATVAEWAERDETARETFRSHASRVLPRFHLPQWQRLQSSLEHLSSAAGEPVEWR